jgi:hypothetical protein
MDILGAEIAALIEKLEGTEDDAATVKTIATLLQGSQTNLNSYLDTIKHSEPALMENLHPVIEGYKASFDRLIIDCAQSLSHAIGLWHTTSNPITVADIQRRNSNPKRTIQHKKSAQANPETKQLSHKKIIAAIEANKIEIGEMERVSDIELDNVLQTLARTVHENIMHVEELYKPKIWQLITQKRVSGEQVNVKIEDICQSYAKAVNREYEYTNFLYYLMRTYYPQYDFPTPTEAKIQEEYAELVPQEVPVNDKVDIKAIIDTQGWKEALYTLLIPAIELAMNAPLEYQKPFQEEKALVTITYNWAEITKPKKSRLGVIGHAQWREPWKESRVREELLNFKKEKNSKLTGREASEARPIIARLKRLDKARILENREKFLSAVADEIQQAYGLHDREDIKKLGRWSKAFDNKRLVINCAHFTHTKDCKNLLNNICYIFWFSNMSLARAIQLLSEAPVTDESIPRIEKLMTKYKFPEQFIQDLDKYPDRYDKLKNNIKIGIIGQSWSQINPIDDTSRNITIILPNTETYTWTIESILSFIQEKESLIDLEETWVYVKWNTSETQAPAMQQQKTNPTSPSNITTDTISSIGEARSYFLSKHKDTLIEIKKIWLSKESYPTFQKIIKSIYNDITNRPNTIRRSEKNEKAAIRYMSKWKNMEYASIQAELKRNSNPLFIIEEVCDLLTTKDKAKL